jgi:lincosamide nucleotidyltransferase A/C/D/E
MNTDPERSAEMRAADVVEVVRLLAGDGLRVHVDGGWGVDALLGRQTRRHNDLDLAVPHRDVPALRALLAARGYREVPRDDTWEGNFVLADAHGREVDVHAYAFDDEGHNVFGVPYPADALTGTGTIDGYPVACISPAWTVRFHTGYSLDLDDYRDVSAVCERFGIALPPEYDRFRA